MKKIIDNKRYDSTTGKAIAYIDHFYDGNFSGTTFLMLSPKGNLFWYTESNGQDIYLQDNIWLGIPDLTGYKIIHEELASQYNLIEEG